MLNLKTNTGLLDALKVATAKKTSSKELLEQRVSFVYGSLKSKSGVTRDQVRQVIVEQEGIEA